MKWQQQFICNNWVQSFHTYFSMGDNNVVKKWIPDAFPLSLCSTNDNKWWNMISLTYKLTARSLGNLITVQRISVVQLASIPQKMKAALELLRQVLTTYYSVIRFILSLYVKTKVRNHLTESDEQELAIF